MCLCSHPCLGSTPRHSLLGQSFPMSCAGRFCFFLPPVFNKKVIQQVLSTSLLFFFFFFFFPSLNALAKGFIAYYPDMCPCFDLSFPVFCCLIVQPSSMAPLTGLLENRTPFFIVFIPRERRKVWNLPTDWLGGTV